MTLDGTLASFLLSLSVVVAELIDNLSSSSSKVLTTKVDGLESKMVALEVLVEFVLERLDHFNFVWKFTMCNVRGINVLTKQENIIRWHRDSGNLIKNKFDKVKVFSFGLNKGFLGAGVAIIMNNSLVRHVYKDMAKTIDFLFVSVNLVNAVVDRIVCNIGEFFNTNHRAVFVLFDFKGADNNRWENFRNATLANAKMLFNKFAATVKFLNLNAMWDVLCRIVVLSTNKIFSKKWFKDFDSVFIKVSSKFHRLKLLVLKIVKAFHETNVGSFVSLMKCWDSLDSNLINSGTNSSCVYSTLSGIRKSYHMFKLVEFLTTKETNIRAAINKRMESFEMNKDYTIRSVLECSFHKVVLDHLVVEDKLILELDLVKSKMDIIMEDWTKKHGVIADVTDVWSCQYRPLDYIFDEAFSGVMCLVKLNELLNVIFDLPNGKAAGLLEGVLMNICPIALIKTACKILPKILSDRISLACSSFDILRGDNFLVLKGTITQSSIFVVGSVVEDKSLVRIKMYSKFIRFFGSIYKNHTNKVMMDFGLMNDYCVHDSLDQGEAGLSSFFAASAFVNDTIWIGSSKAATQYILDICWKKLDPCGLVPEWFKFSVAFLDDKGFFFTHPSISDGVGFLNILEFSDFVSVLYIDGSLSNLDTVGCRAGAAAFFEDINLGLGISVSSLMLSTLVELQAIALALECVFPLSSVKLFLDSQSVLNACNSELGLNLKISWHKVKDHSDISENERTDAIAGNTFLSGWYLLHHLDKCFIVADGSVVSDNSRHFVHDIYHSVCCVYWEVGSDSKFLAGSLLFEIDWLCSSLVWHPDLHMTAGFTSRLSANACSYFIKTLHYWLPVAVQKCLYNRLYSSVLCLYCGNMEASDHVFSYKIDDSTISGFSHSSSDILQMLSLCVSDSFLAMALYKSFIFNDWFCEAVTIFYDPKVAGLEIVKFVHSLSLDFRSSCVYMENNGLIPLNGSVLVSVSGLASGLSAGVVKLLGIADAFSVCFGFRKFCLFFSGISDLVSVYIAA
ncbi:hypothetical protein G9A89_018954 [Geosiphon pyriformis]|nr:hypothetical protein G9A89_018954 [Geosiphon pyriformis]